MKKLVIITLLIPLWCCTSQGPEISRVLQIKDRQVITFPGMIKGVSGSNVILIGESHDSLANHREELAIIKALEVSEVPIAIGLEMFTSRSQAELDRWVEGVTPVSTFIKIYYENWSEPWPMYRDIFLYAREHHIPMIGLNIPEDVSGKVFKSGYNSLTPAEKTEIPPGIQCTVDGKYRNYINEMYNFHNTVSEQEFSNFCEAQMLWDSAMAVNVINWLNRNHTDRKIVVLAGMGHAWKPGIPHQIKTRSKYAYSVILPGLPTGKLDRDITVNDADYLLLDKAG